MRIYCGGLKALHRRIWCAIVRCCSRLEHVSDQGVIFQAPVVCTREIFRSNGFFDVVGDEEDGSFDALPQTEEKFLHIIACLSIECAERFVYADHDHQINRGLIAMGYVFELLHAFMFISVR